MRFWRAALGVGATVAMVLVLAVPASAEHNLVQLTPGGDVVTMMSADGSHVAFSYRFSLIPQDTDSSSWDIYDWHNGITNLASVDENGQNRIDDYALEGISADGRHIVFDETQDQLTSEDTNNGWDVYERFAGTTTRLVSKGPFGAVGGEADGMTPDGSRLFFRTLAQVTPDDMDACADRYERSGGVTTLVYMYDPGCEDATMYGPFETPTGDRWIFSTSASLDPNDTDTSPDLYEKHNGVIRLLSDDLSGPDANQPAGFAGASDLGERVFFSTFENMTPDDTDAACPATPTRNCVDTYEAYNGTVRLATTGPADGTTPARDVEFGSVSEFGGHYYFITSQKLAFDDNDVRSLYEYVNGATRYIGPLNAGGRLHGVSSDGSRAFFSTNATFLPQDTNNAFDVFESNGGTVTMVQPGATNGTSFAGISKSADRVFFNTGDALVPSDTDGNNDLYERFNGNYYRVLPVGANFVDVRVSDDGRTLLVFTSAALSSADIDGQPDYYHISIAPNAYARPKAATPISVPFVPAYTACISPNRVHAAPLSFNSCSPPAQVSQYLTLGTPDANGQPAKSVSDLRLLVLPGNPSTPANEADARYEVSITDVRNAGSLTDYTGALKLDTALQLTDRNNPDVDGGSPNATGSQPSFPVVVPCAATGDTTVGSNCSITTTANTLAPGAAVEGMRAIWETGQFRVSDGGADGNPATTDGEGVFLVQGVFIP